MYLEIENLDYEIENKKICDKIKLQVNKGEFVGIIGPNGSGKSTLLKNIYKVLKPKGGTIYLNSKDLIKSSNREAAEEMSIVAQENNVGFDFSVKEIVLMGRYPSKKLFEGSNSQDIQIVRDALEKVGMESMEKKSFSKLSGGEKQRILIARAIAQDTEFMILDEPTNHLDIGCQIKILKLLRTLKKTILISLHDLNMAAEYCDRIYAIKDGKIVDSGTPKQVLKPELIKELYKVDAYIQTDPNTEKVKINYILS
ncbi:ABC transporter ATP-binding protein [Clostridium cochlearium]|jgi:iron complex transport system ATP-binding protein|uniref:ABC transporter ATP-binding protein n=1 Tax=Clostridium cochlearium TaxID=1494 RepID=A0A2X2WDV0_CLOCO|nr:ABC transporter ATP-binding protein [Clostridium cochlearium]MBE6063798.1 ABC transporter ATP-binding protein [Clostridium cochlearium]MCR1971931.1 ABC transporter ATP-binding protein [Clostridium cochlearium]NMA58713.1 ABC transporter ATP-binding protein [Clostridium cochlearium]NME95244.1 ABC transporter ATP-binding protein [Clostridium cochlearium]NOH15379.1 ABC transporter ATP-binding protein [Clostridium cochlearium]